ncbi:helix-turn-helix domain-containing protein [Muricoccus aerilatus]|uniref:helix-turn-helix domain-containing protein n=1 Tax=Muricoccus aerilatus TaxID=452982 RepID=UPI000A03FDD4
MGWAITRHGLSIGELRQAVTGSRGANAARRMLAIALVLEGASREEAAESCGMDRQTLRDWVHRYYAAGLTGRVSRRAPGLAPRLSGEQEGMVVRWVEEGPHLEREVSCAGAAVICRSGSGANPRSAYTSVRWANF